MPKWKLKVMSGLVVNVSVIALLANVKKVIGNQLVIDLQGAGSIDFINGIYVARAK